MKAWFRKLDNFIRYGLWVECAHEWWQPIRFPGVRRCPHCGAEKYTGEDERWS